ncbi:MAG: hypothetical protein WC631_03360 [Candidatus Paceibacterota bacterium]|jgi:hypothetical protein
MRHLKRGFCDYGDNLYSLARKMIGRAKKLNNSVCIRFNGIIVTAHPKGSSVKSIVRNYEKEWGRSPEGRAEILKEKAEDRKYLRLKRKAIAQGIVPFKVRNKNLWAEIVETNKREMMGMLRFASRWAQIMEIKIGEGKKLSRIAGWASHKVDTETISGLEFKCALDVLCKVWKYGKELERHYFRG